MRRGRQGGPSAARGSDALRPGGGYAEKEETLARKPNTTWIVYGDGNRLLPACPAGVGGRRSARPATAPTTRENRFRSSLQNWSRSSGWPRGKSCLAGKQGGCVLRRLPCKRLQFHALQRR